MSLFIKLEKFIHYLRYQRTMKRYLAVTKKSDKLKAKLTRYSVLASDVAAVEGWLKYFSALLTRLALRPLYLLPIKPNRVLAMSFQAAQFACNPKYITEYLKTQYPGEFEITWAFRDAHKFSWLEDWGYKTIKMYSLRYFVYTLTSKVIIYNMRMPIVVPYRKSQISIGTGHGGGAYKKLLLDNPELRKLDKKEITLANANTKIYVSSCAAYTYHVVRGAFGHTGEVMECGMPRNDMLVNRQFTMAANVRRYYQIPEGNKIILYAPTYRKGTRWASDYNIDMKRVIDAARTRFGGEWTILFRLHYFIKQNLVSSFGVSFVDATNYWDMQELLLATDILITDYSSSVWDYSLLDKPGFLYATDLDEYKGKQGFYTELTEWPFTIAENNDELVANILAFDEDACKAKIRKHHADLGSREDGHATETIARRIHQECFGN